MSPTSVRFGSMLQARCQMPIFFMALLALAMFVGMGLMLFYAAYAETKTEHELARKGSVELKPGSETHAPVA